MSRFPAALRLTLIEGTSHTADPRRSASAPGDRLREGESGDAPPVLDDRAGLAANGDLWGGNCYPGPDGEPVLIDPAVYRGHAEVDLAMTELFGGFPDDFLDAYREAGRVGPAYGRRHRPLYQLYYLLVHVDLFGTSYVGRTLDAAERALRG